MKSLWPVLVIAVAITSVPLGGVARQHVLDLTRPDLVVTSPAVTTGGAAAMSGQKPIDLPLELQLTRLDRRVYIVGTPVRYDVVVRNMGQAAFGFPWSTDRELIERDGESFSQITVA